MTTNNILIRRYIIVGERRFSNYWWALVIFLGSCGFLFTGISSYLGSYNPDIFAVLNGASSINDVALNQIGSENLELTPFASLQQNQAFTSTDCWQPGVCSGVENSPQLQTSLGTSDASKGMFGFQNSVPVPFFPQGLLMSFYGSLGFLLSLYWCLLIFWNVGGGFNEFNKKDGFVRIFRWGYPGKNRKIDLSYKISDVEAIRVELKQGLDPQRTIYLCLKGSTNKTKREIPLTGIGQPLTLKEIEKQASELANFLQVSLEA